jgi:Ser/Thr protein kinase RdoA (MazF antagonist)
VVHDENVGLDVAQEDIDELGAGTEQRFAAEPLAPVQSPASRVVVVPEGWELHDVELRRQHVEPMEGACNPNQLRCRVGGGQAVGNLRRLRCVAQAPSVVPIQCDAHGRQCIQRSAKYSSLPDDPLYCDPDVQPALKRSLMLFDRSRDAQLRRLRSIAREILAEHFAISPDAMRLQRYEDNAVYAIVTGNDRYSLRLSIRDGRTEQEQLSELAFLEAIRGRGRVRVPDPMPAQPSGSVVAQRFDDLPEPCTAVLFRWINGRGDPRYTRALARLLGTVTATFHEDASTFSPPADFRRPHWGVTDLFEHGAALNDRRAPVTLGDGGVETVRAVGRRVDRTLGREGGEWGLIHADLHAENLIATPGKQIAIIDFDDCGFGWSMLDIATIAASMRRRAGDDGYQALARQLVEGYQEVRPLPSPLERIDDFLILRDMVILNFVTGSRNPTVAEWGPQRAQGIVAGLRRWLNGEPYTGHFEC